MKREPFPFYPLLVAAFPVVSVYSANLAYVPPTHLWRPLLVVVLATAAFGLAFGLAFRSAARGAAAATVLTLCLFGYAWATDWIGRQPVFYGLAPIGIWGIGTAVLLAFAAWKVKVVRPLNVLASFLTVVALANVGLRLVQAQSLGARGPRAALGASVSGANASGARPDIVYIILDGYGRSDAVRRAIGYDNSAFIEGLRKRGFYVADQSHSNYCQTELSLSSSLNMDFVQRLLPNVRKDTEERKPLAGLVEDNEVVRRLRAKGYRFVAITSGFPPVTFEGADLNLSDASGGRMVESALLRMTPFVSDQAVRSQFVTRRQELLTAFDNLRTLAQPTPAPRFVVAHILAPHPPFVFGPNGEEIAHKGMFGFFDGSDYMTFVSTPEEYRRRWAGQAEFVGKKVLEALDRILPTSGPRPIVVIQGDHGSKVGLDQNSLAKTDLHECFPILNAYLVPESIKKDLRSDITPVNTFRTILRDLFGDDLPPLPNQSWYSRYITPYDFTEVTDQIEPVPKTTYQASKDRSP